MVWSSWWDPLPGEGSLNYAGRRSHITSCPKWSHHTNTICLLVFICILTLISPPSFIRYKHHSNAPSPKNVKEIKRSNQQQFSKNEPKRSTRSLTIAVNPTLIPFISSLSSIRSVKSGGGHPQSSSKFIESGISHLYPSHRKISSMRITQSETE